MEIVTDWNGRKVATRRSRGCSRVLTFEHWSDNVIMGASTPWPPPELERQVRSYTATPTHFVGRDQRALSADLNSISKFQSVNSEDALTWSWFGTLAHAAPATRRDAVTWLYRAIGLDEDANQPAIRLWPRVYHPNAPRSSGGPEIDAVIDDPDRAFIYVEAKWHATIGTGRGNAAGTRDDQIVLRRDSLRTDPALAEDRRKMFVLGVSQSVPPLDAYRDSSRQRPVMIRWLTWDQLAGCPPHPHHTEFARYLSWKRKHSQRPSQENASEGAGNLGSGQSWL